MCVLSEQYAQNDPEVSCPVHFMFEDKLAWTTVLHNKKHDGCESLVALHPERQGASIIQWKNGHNIRQCITSSQQSTTMYHYISQHTTIYHNILQ